MLNSKFVTKYSEPKNVLILNFKVSLVSSAFLTHKVHFDNTTKRTFIDNVKLIYLSKLNFEKSDRSDDQAYKLTLTFIICSSKILHTKQYQKCDNFRTFNPLPSDVVSGPSYGVYISQFMLHIS